METWIYFSALSIAFGLGFAVCMAVFADKIGASTPSTSHSTQSTAIAKIASKFNEKSRQKTSVVIFDAADYFELIRQLLAL